MNVPGPWREEGRIITCHLAVFVCLIYEYMIVYVWFVYTEEHSQVE